LLQVLDNGRLTDNKGRVADFKNTIIIMTSNLGATAIQDAYDNTSNPDEAYNQSKNEVMNLLRQTLRPEFLNRIDEIIMFKPLTESEIIKYDPQYGARPLKRYIQKNVINELSRQILAGGLDKEKPVSMDVFDGKYVFYQK
jgi:ATP-dependent Clp protease ATP-binding subunit ClpB